MAEERETGQPPRVAVVDREVPETGWQRLDLSGLTGLPPRIPLGPVGPFPLPNPRTRPAGSVPLIGAVPSDALVSIAPAGPARRYAKRGPGPSANDNGRSVRSPWRDAFFLLILFTTVAVAFWGGRLHGYQKIIVAPQPISAGGVIT